MKHVSFCSLALSDVPLMLKWFNSPHVQKFYSLRQWTEIEVLEKLKPIITGEKPVHGYIVAMDEQPIGYVQQCKVSDFPWPNQNLPQEIFDNAAGVDLFIGDEALLGKGMGGLILKEFLDIKIWPKFKYCLVDPDIKNNPAIRCYEKLGFNLHAVIEAKDTLGQAATLNLMILLR